MICGRNTEELDDAFAISCHRPKYSMAIGDFLVSEKANNVYQAAMALSAEERAEVVARLLDIEDELDAEQDATIRRRSDEVDRGVANLVPGDTAMRLYRERKKV